MPTRHDPPHDNLPAPVAPPLAQSLAMAAESIDLHRAILSGRNARTVRAYESDFRDFAAFVGAETPAEALDALIAQSQGTAAAVALAYRTHLVARKLAPATVARRLAAIRSACKLAKTLGRVTWDLSVEAPQAEALRDTSGPGDDGWRAMLTTAKAEATTPIGKRDLALMRLLHDLALRRAEAIALDLADVDLDGGTVSITGKGRSEPIKLTLPPPVKRDLASWLGERGPEPGPVFIRLDRAAKDLGRLNGRTVAKLVLGLSQRAGLSRPAKPHGLRHQGITAALDATNGDIRSVQRFSRHKSLNMVLKYDDNRRDVAGETARKISID